MFKLQASNGKIDLQANNGSIALKVPITQTGGGAVTSVNGMTGDVVLEIPNIEGLASIKYVDDGLATKQDTLTAGTNISIQNGVISAAGGVSGYAFHSNQTLTEEDKAHLKQIYNDRNIHMTIDGLTVVRMMSLATKWGFVVINTNGAMSNRVMVYSVNIDSSSGSITSDKFVLTMSYYLVGNSNMVSGEVLTSNNWSQYITLSGGGDWQYTGNASDSGLYNAKEMVLYWYDNNNVKRQSYLNFTANFNGDLEQTLGTGWANEEIRLDADDTINYPSVTYNGSALTAANCNIAFIAYKA